MSDLVNVVEVSLAFEKKVILNEISFNLSTSEVVGLVGKNGAGKTSLLRILAGETEVDSGEIKTINNLRVGYLPQEFSLNNQKTIYENILEADYFKENEAIPEIQTEIEDLIRELRCEQKTRLVSSLSGGQKRRVALAKALINKPDLLILDEPTNHLDLETVEHVEKLVRGFKGSVLLVSHDRYFLDRVTTRILELYDGDIFSHKGNYSDYLRSKELRLEILEKSDERRKQFLKKEKEWVYAGVKARATKNKGRLKRYYELSEMDDFRREKPPQVLLPESTPLGNKILNLKNVTIKTPGGETVLKDFDFQFVEGMKIGLLGPNGVGKSTFLRTLTGELEVDSGKIIFGKNTVFNYLDQEKIQLDPNKTIFEEVADERENIKFGSKEMNSRAYLKKFLFGNEDIKKPISQLSGGERTRLVLAKILKKGGNFLVLDEPTNDLDLEMLKALENSIQRFVGCSVIVSHDRYFLNEVCNHIIFFGGNGQMILSTGNYDNFVKKFGGVETALKEIQNSTNVFDQENEPKKKTGKEARLERQKIRELEKEMKSLETKIQKLETEFNTPDFYEKNGNKVIDLFSDLQKLKEELSQKESFWLELQD